MATSSMRRTTHRAVAALATAVALATGLTPACSDDPAAGDRDAVLVVFAHQDADADAVLEPAVLAWLTPMLGHKPAVAHLAAGAGADAIAALAAKHGAGLVLALDAAVPPAAVQLAGDAFWLESIDRGGAANALDGSAGATLLLGRAASRNGRFVCWTEGLRRLGARFFHPEQPWLPRQQPADLRRLARTPTALARAPGAWGGDEPRLYAPDFRLRAFTFHGAHPLEHLESFSDSDWPIGEAQRVNLWIAANRGNVPRGTGRGVAPAARLAKRAEELATLHRALGMIRSTGLTLHNEQQGASASIDPSLPTPPLEQIDAVVQSRLAEGPGAFTTFGIHFGPTELTTTPDLQTLSWIDRAGAKALAIDPNLLVFINDHATGAQPVEHKGDLGCPPGTNDAGKADYYDLAFHADPRLGVQVHTVMFHPLEGPAHVYNQKTFAHKLCLMQQASAQGRPLWWFPEGAWWLAFDNPIPVYLPLYVWTRGRDVELLKPLLQARGTGTLLGHKMFNSGHEWGYWQQDYAVGLWHFHADLPMSAVWGEILDPLCAPSLTGATCAAKDEALAVMQEVVDEQRAQFLDAPDYRGLAGGRYAYFAGEDPADDLAEAAGIGFRPVRVPFRVVAHWDADKRKAFADSDVAALAVMEDHGIAWRDRLLAVRPLVPAPGWPWLDEIIDGIEINALRARHARQLYLAALAFGEARDKRAASAKPELLPTPREAGWQLLGNASATIAEVTAVIRRREAHYRYPHAQTNGGGWTPDTAVANGTTYPWRVHARTHHLHYWLNRQSEAQAAIEGSADPLRLRIDPALAPPGKPVSIVWPAVAGLKAQLTMGDGSTVTETAQTHNYGAAAGAFRVGGAMTLDGREVEVRGAIVRSAGWLRSKAGALKLLQPTSPVAAGVLGGIWPAFVWAQVNQLDGAPAQAWAFGPDLDGDGAVPFDDLAAAPVLDPSAATPTTAPVDMLLPVPAPGTGLEAARLRLQGVTLSLEPPSPSGQWVMLQGQIVLDDLVQALIVLAGFDAKGAHQTLAGVLGYDAKAPPAAVAVKARIGPLEVAK